MVLISGFIFLAHWSISLVTDVNHTVMTMAFKSIHLTGHSFLITVIFSDLFGYSHLLFHLNTEIISVFPKHSTLRF